MQSDICVKFVSLLIRLKTYLSAILRKSGNFNMHYILKYKRLNVNFIRYKFVDMPINVHKTRESC